MSDLELIVYCPRCGCPLDGVELSDSIEDLAIALHQHDEDDICGSTDFTPGYESRDELRVQADLIFLAGAVVGV